MILKYLLYSIIPKDINKVLLLNYEETLRVYTSFYMNTLLVRSVSLIGRTSDLSSRGRWFDPRVLFCSHSWSRTLRLMVTCLSFFLGLVFGHLRRYWLFQGSWLGRPTTEIRPKASVENKQTSYLYNILHSRIVRFIVYFYKGYQHKNIYNFTT